MSMRSLPQTRQARPGVTTTIVIVLLVLGSVLVVLFGASTTDLPSRQIVYGSLALFLLGLASAVGMAREIGLRRSLASGQLGPYFGLSTAVIFGLASLIWASSNPPSQQAAIVSLDSVLFAMLVVATGLACFVLGYMVVATGPLNPAGSWLRRLIVTERPFRSGQRPAWLLMGLALIADVTLVLLGSFGYLSDPVQSVSSANPLTQPLSTVGTFSVFAVALSAYDYAHRRGPRRLLSFSILLGVQSGLGIFSGVKETIVMGFVAALLGYAARVRRLPLLPVFVAALVFVFVLVPINTNYRSAISTGNSRLSPLEAIQQFSQQGIGSFLALTQNATQSTQAQSLVRISRIGDVGIIVQQTPSYIPNRPLSELLEAPGLGLVPRLLWPDKPILATGYLFSQQYYQLPAYIYTSNAVTPQGDLWRHGGWPILVAGMMLLGVGVRILDNATVKVSDYPLCLLLLLVFFPLIVKQETDIVSLAAAIPSLLLGVAVAARLVTLGTDPNPKHAAV